jgi:lipopolysaccharide biosynthesis protein
MSQLGFSKTGAVSAARRVYRKIFPSIVGTPRPFDTDFSLSVPFGYDLSSVSCAERIAVVCHIFHADLAAYMRSMLDNIPFSADVFVSTDTAAKRDVIADAFAGWSKGKCEIRISVNRGRDIAPKLVTFRDVYDSHQLILFLHSKKSPHVPFGEGWRQSLMNSLVGSPDIVRSVIDLFSQDATIGLVVPQHFEPIRQFLVWDKNFWLARRLARRMGFRITPKQLLDMPSGSMFWARPAALRPLLDLDIKITDFPAEQAQLKRTNAHAIERIFFHICEHAGYQWIKVANPGYYNERRTILAVGSRAELARSIKTSCIRLLDS